MKWGKDFDNFANSKLLEDLDILQKLKTRVSEYEPLTYD